MDGADPFAELHPIEQNERNESVRERLVNFFKYNEYLVRGLGKREYMDALHYHNWQLERIYGCDEVLEFLLNCSFFHPNANRTSLSHELSDSATFACVNLFYEHTFTLGLMLPGAVSHTYLNFVVQKMDLGGKSSLCIVFVPSDSFKALGIPQTFASLDDVMQHVYGNPPDRKTWRQYRVCRRTDALK